MMLTVATLKGCVTTLSKNETLLELLRETAAIMPREQSWYFIGGCIYQTVWNLASGRPANASIEDYDLVYFDRRSGVVEQQEYESRIGGITGVRVEVKNQALITAEWFEHKYGCPKDTADYLSLEDSIAKAYVSSPVVGVTWQDEELQVLALADLDKLLKLEVFPNRKFRDERVMPFYRQKCAKWHRAWPTVKFHEWEAQ